MGKYPYNNYDVLALSHYSRYPQLLYAQAKYQNNDITGYHVNTQPGEYVLFDPALLHSNGALSWTIDDIEKSAIKRSDVDHIQRLSLAIRVLHSPNQSHHHLWMSAPERLQTFEKFFEQRCKNNDIPKLSLSKKTDTIYTVLCNNKIASPDTPYFSVSEMHELHVASS